MKKLTFAAFVAAASSLPVLAQEVNAIDLTAAGTAATTIGNSIKGLITDSILPAVLVVVGASLTIWGIFLVVRWIRKGAK